MPGAGRRGRSLSHAHRANVHPHALRPGARGLRFEGQHRGCDACRSTGVRNPGRAVCERPLSLVSVPVLAAESARACAPSSRRRPRGAARAAAVHGLSAPESFSTRLVSSTVVRPTTLTTAQPTPRPSQWHTAHLIYCYYCSVDPGRAHMGHTSAAVASVARTHASIQAG